MKEKLMDLYNTMSMIETKGKNTRIMAECLGFVEGLIKEEPTKETKEDVKESK